MRSGNQLDDFYGPQRYVLPIQGSWLWCWTLFGFVPFISIICCPIWLHDWALFILGSWDSYQTPSQWCYCCFIPYQTMEWYAPAACRPLPVTIKCLIHKYGLLNRVSWEGGYSCARFHDSRSIYMTILPPVYTFTGVFHPEVPSLASGLLNVFSSLPFWFAWWPITFDEQCALSSQIMPAQTFSNKGYRGYIIHIPLPWTR